MGGSWHNAQWRNIIMGPGCWCKSGRDGPGPESFRGNPGAQFATMRKHVVEAIGPSINGPLMSVSEKIKYICGAKKMTAEKHTIRIIDLKMNKKKRWFLGHNGTRYLSLVVMPHHYKLSKKCPAWATADDQNRCSRGDRGENTSSIQIEHMVLYDTSQNGVRLKQNQHLL